MPRPYDQLNPIFSDRGDAVGPEGPPGPPGAPNNQPFDLQMFSGNFSTTLDGPVRVGSRFVDLSPFPAIDVVGRVRRIEFVANLEVGAAGTANVRLLNREDVEVVTGTAMLTTNTTNTELRSGPLSVGTSGGDLKDDRTYEPEIFHTGGSPSDAATITNARLEISYV